MRFAAAAAVLATSVLAHKEVAEPTSVAYLTEIQTVTACPPEEAARCPLRSKTRIISTTRSAPVPVTTSSVPVSVPTTISTVYSTSLHTVIKCDSTVINCPASSTSISTQIVSVSTTICPISSATQTPSVWNNSTVSAGGKPPSDKPTDLPGGEKPTDAPKPSGPVGSQAPACPTHSVTAITKSYTTVLTSVEYSTIAVPCPTEGKPAGPSGAQPPAGSTSVPQSPAGGNNTCTGVNCPPKSPVTAGAASLAGSAVFAVAAGLAAFVLA